MFFKVFEVFEVFEVSEISEVWRCHFLKGENGCQPPLRLGGRGNAICMFEGE